VHSKGLLKSVNDTIKVSLFVVVVCKHYTTKGLVSRNNFCMMQSRKGIIMTDTSPVFAAALNALLIKRYDKMTCFFDEAVINGCIEDARKIVALANNGNKEDKIIILPSLEEKKPRGRRPKAKI
jgi:hypothetical protein